MESINSGRLPYVLHSCSFDIKRCFTPRRVASAEIAALLASYKRSVSPLVRSNYSTSISRLAQSRNESLW